MQLCPETNLAAAAGVTATASHPIATRPAERAIDGRIITNWFGGEVGAGTGDGEHAYIDLTLPQSADVEDVVLWNRTDGARGRFRDLTVWASERPFASADPDVLRQDPNVTAVTRLGDHSVKRTLTFPVNNRAQYIRVQSERSIADRLLLTEIVVTGSMNDGEDGGACRLEVDGDKVTVTWDGVGGERIVYRSVDGSPLYWRVRTSEASYTETLRNELPHRYAVATVGVDGRGPAVACTPNPVMAGPTNTVSLTSTYQDRGRVVLRWTPAAAVTILRDGTEIAQDNDGWYTDIGLTPGTNYHYELVADGQTVASLDVATRP